MKCLRITLVAALLLMTLSLLATSCSTTSQSPSISTPPSSVPPSTPSPGKSTEASSAPITCPPKTWCPAYSQFLQAHFTESMLAATPGVLCPGLKRATPEFWAALVQAVAHAESGYNPATEYEENFKDALTGKKALSVGMLQLSVGDKLNYKTPYCQKLTPESLKDPETNLGCGLEIMTKLVGSRPTLQESLGRYWSTIRPGGRAVAKLKELMPVCR